MLFPTCHSFLTHICWLVLRWIFKVTLCRSLEFSTCTALSSLVFCPMNSSYLHLPSLSTMSPQFRESICLQLWFSSLVPWCRNSFHKVPWGNHGSLHVFALCLVFEYNCFICSIHFSCFIWEGKYSPYYSILFWSVSMIAVLMFIFS